MSALIEVCACAQFGIRSISKAWFNHTFVYEPPKGELAFMPDGMSLNLSIQTQNIAFIAARQRLRHYYGIDFKSDPFRDFDQLLNAIVSALEEGVVTISTFDLGFMTGRRAEGLERFSFGGKPPANEITHSIGIIGYDASERALIAIDNVKFGPFEVGLDDYRDCFAHVLSKGGPFMLARCTRELGHQELGFVAGDIRRDLEVSLANLRSRHPNLGLLGLERALASIRKAIDTFRSPFWVPGMWTFMNERHNLKLNVGHWEAAGAADRAALAELERLLDIAFRSWFRVNAILEDQLARASAQNLSELTRLFDAVVPVEYAIAKLFEDVLSGLPAV